MVIARPGHRLAGRQVRPGELAGERFILRERGSSTRTMQTTALALWELAEIASIEVWGIETVKQSVHAGLRLSRWSPSTRSPTRWPTGGWPRWLWTRHRPGARSSPVSAGTGCSRRPSRRSRGYSATSGSGRPADDTSLSP
ncbi:MAG: hypothetical protein J2P20_02905 [Pseudonocardia sp.]|nr:hypothetical protein [Pseudonocardia sp.]